MTVPLADGYAEFLEKRSRFIGRVRRAESEERAMAYINEARQKYDDARHNVFAYITPDAQRYSDDGEPGGSAGLPVMSMLLAEGVSEICCVVTRYFGGILLGFGGLQRAYVKAARLALDRAGTGVQRELMGIKITCPYSLYERVTRFLKNGGAVIEDADFAAAATITAWIGADNLEQARTALRELSGGTVTVMLTGEAKRTVY